MDDLGLVVDCLDGAPGIYSARFAGVEGDDEANNRKLVEMCSRFPYKKRTARYVCVITAVFPDGDIIVASAASCPESSTAFPTIIIHDCFKKT